MDNKKENKSEVSVSINNEIVTGDLLANAFRNLNAEQANAISVRATEEALRLQVKAREQMIDSQTAREQTLDHIDTFNDLPKEGRLTRHSMKTTMKTGSGDRVIESKSGAGCFVATSAFDGADHPTVVKLRRYRDDYLIHSSLGRWFINWYYKSGPKMAEILDKVSFAKPLVRAMLNLVVAILYKRWR